MARLPSFRGVAHGVVYRAVVRAPALLVGALRGNAIRAYWYRDVTNFGDLITPALLRFAGFTPVHTPAAEAQVVAVGSVLEHVGEAFSGVVLGSGFMHEASRAEFAGARVLSVRGPLTLERLGRRHGSASLGDLGLLAPVLLRDGVQRDESVGIVFHHAFPQEQLFARLHGRLGGVVRRIHAGREPGAVMRDIASCGTILSSSLHGLIVADALGIPAGWLSEDRVLGGRFKFEDHFAAVRVDGRSPRELRGDEDLATLRSYAVAAPAGRIQELQGIGKQLLASLEIDRSGRRR